MKRKAQTLEVPIRKNKKETNNQNDVEETQDILQMYELLEELLFRNIIEHDRNFQLG